MTEKRCGFLNQRSGAGRDEVSLFLERKGALRFCLDNHGHLQACVVFLKVYYVGIEKAYAPLAVATGDGVLVVCAAMNANTFVRRSAQT